MRAVPPLHAAGLSQRDNRYRLTDTQPATAVWTFSGLKARDVTAWSEAQRAKPQVKVRKENPLRAESAGHRVEMMPLFCFDLSGLGEFWETGYLGLHSLRSLQPRL